MNTELYNLMEKQLLDLEGQIMDLEWDYDRLVEIGEKPSPKLKQTVLALYAEHDDVLVEFNRRFLK